MKTLSLLVHTMALGALLVPAATHARTKLVTLPDRSAMVVNLENPRHALLSEEREVPLQKGTNHVDFSWQGVSIDPRSITIELLSNPGDSDTATKVINVAYPPGEAALTWQLYSPEARTERVRVSYLLYGVNRTTSYDFLTNAEETATRFRQYVQVTNASGENLDDAGLRIAQAEDWTRTVATGETRKFLAVERPELPIRKLFITEPGPESTKVDGEEINLVYEFTNDRASNLGTFQLERGKVRLFSVDPTGSSIFTGEDHLAGTAVGEDNRLTLGTVRDVVLKRRIMGDKRENEKTNNSSQVVLYDRRVHLRYEVENFKDKDSTVIVRETLPFDAEIVEGATDGVRLTRKSAGELEIEIDLDPRPADAKEEVTPREVDIVYVQRQVIATDRRPVRR